jgi:hypothetical protein
VHGGAPVRKPVKPKKADKMTCSKAIHDYSKKNLEQEKVDA